MRTFKKTIVGLILATSLISVQVQAQIQTTAIGRGYEMNPPSEFKQFSSTTPCYLKWSKNFPSTFSTISKALKETGFNITDDDSASCLIEITGYLTVPSKTSGSVPVNLNYVLDNISKIDTVGPALKSSDNAGTGKVANNASGMTDGPLDPNVINSLSQVGNVVRGVSGSVVLDGIGTLVNILSGIHARQTTPPGVVYINAVVMFNIFIPGAKKQALVLGAYAASTEPEKPDALIDAGVKRVAQAIWEHTAAYDKKKGVVFTMPTILQSDAGITKQSSVAGQEVTSSTIVADKLANQSATPPSSEQPAPNKPAQNAAQANSDCTDPCADCLGKPAQDTAQTTPK